MDRHSFESDRQSPNVETKVRDDFISKAQSYVDDTDNTILSSLAVSVIFVSVSLIIAFFFGASLNRPLTSITNSMKLLASRNLETVIFYTGNPDEIGEIARAVAVFKTNAIENARLRAEQEEQKARAAEEQKQALNRMADSFKARVMDVVKTVAASSTELQSTAQAMSPRPSPRPSRSKGPPPARSPATSSRRPAAPGRSPPTSPTSHAPRKKPPPPPGRF